MSRIKKLYVTTFVPKNPKRIAKYELWERPYVRYVYLCKTR